LDNNINLKKMKKIIGVALAAACTCPSQAAGEQNKLDTTRVNNLNEVVVKAVRAPKSSPFAVENINKPELERFATSGRELPMLFARTPGVLAWSENGVGTGTVYMRMRGAAGSRINVTVDGVPLNSPEDQCVFWANMNSYAALMGSAQIQRGIGSSTNGDGAFGGAVSLATAAPSLKPTVEVTGSYGSFNTYRFGGKFSTGLLWDHLVLDGAYHETNTDGYIHGTSGRSGSYYGGLTWFGDRFKISYTNIGVLTVGFVDENSFLHRFQLEMQISDLEEEIAKYNAQNESDLKKLKEMRQGPQAFQKIARERYFMKADDEDIYVLSDDPQPEKAKE
jgi:iron complex outermembrane recepter protein